MARERKAAYKQLLASSSWERWEDDYCWSYRDVEDGLFGDYLASLAHAGENVKCIR